MVAGIAPGPFPQADGRTGMRRADAVTTAVAAAGIATRSLMDAMPPIPDDAPTEVGQTIIS